MNGPTHYREAESLLAMVAEPNHPLAPAKDRDALIALAQVHATLALAAATALPVARARVAADSDAWIAAVASSTT